MAVTRSPKRPVSSTQAGVFWPGARASTLLGRWAGGLDQLGPAESAGARSSGLRDEGPGSRPKSSHGPWDWSGLVSARERLASRLRAVWPLFSKGIPCPRLEGERRRRALTVTPVGVLPGQHPLKSVNYYRI